MTKTMKLDPTKLKDWQIAEAAEKNAKTIEQLADELGLEKSELLPYGHTLGKIDQVKVIERLSNEPQGKYIEVTAITPTHLGDGKSPTTMGLFEGLGK